MEQAYLSSVEKLYAYLEGKAAVLLYFYSDHCAPCTQLRPKIKELISNEFNQVELILVNAETHPELTAGFGAFSFPVLILFFDGKEFRRYSKYISLHEFRRDTERPYNLIFDD
jgi:thiol-disulfide isomerase/thioredoxin